MDVIKTRQAFKSSLLRFTTFRERAGERTCFCSRGDESARASVHRKSDAKIGCPIDARELHACRLADTSRLDDGSLRRGDVQIDENLPDGNSRKLGHGAPLSCRRDRRQLSAVYETALHATSRAKNWKRNQRRSLPKGVSAFFFLLPLPPENSLAFRSIPQSRRADDAEDRLKEKRKNVVAESPRLRN